MRLETSSLPFYSKKHENFQLDLNTKQGTLCKVAPANITVSEYQKVSDIQLSKNHMKQCIIETLSKVVSNIHKKYGFITFFIQQKYT